jgi:hypothetical protein
LQLQFSAERPVSIGRSVGFFRRSMTPVFANVARIPAALGGLIALATLVAAVSPLRAGTTDGLFLRWNDCPLAASSVSTMTFGCSSDVGEELLVAAITLGETVDDVIAVEVVIDIQFAGAAVPPWWQIDPAGCRDGALIARSAPPQNPACTDFWNQTLTPGLLYQIAPRGNPSQARVVVSFALPSTTPPRQLVPGPTYYVASIAVQNQRTSQCTGCLTNACLVLNSVRLGRVPGSPGQDPMIVQPGPLEANHATWQGAGAACQSVPTRSSTWGRLKSLYR